MNLFMIYFICLLVFIILTKKTIINMKIFYSHFIQYFYLYIFELTNTYN